MQHDEKKPALPRSLMLVKLLGFALLLVLLSFNIYKAFSIPMWRDSATFAVVAKNLVLGHGYAAVLWDGFYPFDPGITTGPVMILPTAFMIAVFGNAYWVPSVTSILIIFLLLGAAYHQLKHLLHDDAARSMSVALFLLSIMLVSNHFMENLYSLMIVWHSLHGDLPCALFILIAILYIARNRYNPATLFWGGVIAGLGTLCKLQAMIAACVIGVYLVTQYLAGLCRKASPEQYPLKGIILYPVGVMLPQACFEAVKIRTLGGWQNYMAYLHAFPDIVRNYNATPHTAEILAKFYQLAEFWGITTLLPANTIVILLAASLVFLAAAIYSGTLWIINLRRHTTAVEWAASVLLCCSVTHFFWWLFICSLIMPRYAVEAIIYGCGALAVMAGRSVTRNQRTGSIAFVIVMCVLIGVRYDAVLYFYTGLTDDAALQEEQQALQVIGTLKANHPDVIIFSCGMTLEMEYLLPTSGNFVLCDQMDEPRFAGHPHVLLSDYLIPGAMIYKGDKVMGATLRDNPKAIRDRCPADDIYAGTHYFIASCN